MYVTRDLISGIVSGLCSVGTRRQGRNFDGVTYLNFQQISDVLQAHWEQIDWWAFCRHDQDKLYPLNPDVDTLKVAHTHIVLRTYSPLPRSTVRNWFYGDYTDDNGERINTLFDFTRNPPGALRYLMHMDHPHKHQYAREEVFTNNPDFDEYIKTNDYDDCTLYAAALDLNKGLSYDDLCRRYGRDFIIHYKDIVFAARALRDEEIEFYTNPQKLTLMEELYDGFAEDCDPEDFEPWDEKK